MYQSVLSGLILAFSLGKSIDTSHKMYLKMHEMF